MATLTRLTQELFTDLVKVRARLDELEEEAGITAGSGGAAPADATLVGSDGSSRRSKGLAVNGSGSGSGGQQQHARHRLAGVVRLGGGLMWAQVCIRGSMQCCTLGIALLLCALTRPCRLSTR